jgi:hypothetical protein
MEPQQAVCPERKKKKKKLKDSSHGKDLDESVEELYVSPKGKEIERPPLFACPYYKNNPARYSNERGCCGPGWYNISRLK